MEQITAEEIALEKYPVVLKYDDMKMIEEDINADARHYFIEGLEFASLRSVSETKEPDGYNEFELRQVIAKYKNEHKYLGTTEGLAKLIIERFPVYFSPVPVSEVGQMEAIKLTMSYLESFKNDWKEAEEYLYFKLESAIKNEKEI